MAREPTEYMGLEEAPALFCDFYNPEGECEWHYKPCGSPCLKTCRNPSGQCMNQLQGFEDTEMSNLSFSICTKKGRRCQMNVRDFHDRGPLSIKNCLTYLGLLAQDVCRGLQEVSVSTPPTSVSCLEEVCKWSQWYDVTCPKYGNNEGDFETFQNVRRKGHSICKAPSSVQCRAQKFPKIPIADLGQIVQCNKSMGLICHNRDQFSQLCFNYEIKILCCSYVPCSETVKPPISVSTSSPPLISATSKSTKTTLPSTVASKYTVSTKPSHSTQSSVKTTVTFTSDVSRKTSAKPHQTSTRSQEASLTTPCKKQMCTWSPWYDVHFPSIVASDGDFETLDNIRAAGNNICQTPQEIECRAEKFPDKNITDIGQIVICNTTNGLICNNRDQDFNFPLCYNYKVRIFCCSMVDCESTTTSVHTTVKDHTSRQSQETSVLTRTTVHKSTESGVTSNKTTSKIMSSTPHLDHTSLVTGTEFKSTVYSSVSTKTTRTPNETATSSHIIVSSKSTPLTSLPAFKTTQTNVGTVKTFTLPKTTASTSFESVLTSKPVTRTEPASQKQDHTSQTEVTPLKTTTVPSSSSKYASETSIAKHTASTAGDHHTTTTSLLKTSMIQTPTTGIRVSSAQTSAVTRTTAGSFESILTSIPLTESTMINTFTNTNVSIYPLYSTTEEKELHTSITISHTSKITTPKAFSTTGKISCIPTCQWSQWFDVSFPNINTNGDFETYEDIRKSGFAICQEPTDIQCRSADLPDIPLEELQQNVQCNVSYGLSCQNEDQMGPFPYCLNYEIRVLCCSACASTEVLPTFTQPETSKLSWHITEQSPPEETSKTLTTATPKEKTTKERVPFSESTIETTLSKSSTYLKTESSQPYTTHKTDSIKTSKMATTSGEVTLTNTDYSKYSSLSTSKSSQEDHSTSHGPISSKVTTPTIKLTTMEEVYTYTPMQKTSRLITAPLEMTTRKSSTAEKKSTVKESTSSSGKTTRETGPMTSTYKSTPFIPITTKVTSPKVSTAHLKFTTESEHEITSQGLISIKTTEISREPIMTKATSPKVSSISQEITTESQYEATTAYKSVPFKTTRLSTESTELKAALVSLPDVPMTTKLLVPLLSTISQRATTENKETSSHGLVSIKTTHTSKESSEVTSAHKSTPSEPINTKATSPQVNTISHESTTESEHEEFTSQVPISIKTTKLSTASGKVTSAQKITSGKPMTTKATSPKLGTISHKSTTESEQEETISPGPISIKTTKLSTASGEVTSEKPMTTKATSPKLSTTSYKSTTESEQEETTSPGWISSQITKMSTESKEVTSSYKSSPGKPITTKAISSKITTISAKSTTESEHEEMTSHVAGSMKTTKMSTESGEVTSEHISVSSSKPVTTKATSLKVSTIPHKFTTESEHEKYTSQGLISIKTTKLSTARASGEVTSEKPMTTIATSPKLSTISHKSTTESEQEETTSTVWISSKTTKMSTESGVVTSSYKSSPGKPITTKVTSSKITTISPKSTTEYEHEEITSQVAGSMKTTKMSTRSGEVTSEHISVASKPVGTKATSLKVSTIPHKSTTESEHEEYTSQGPSSIKTTKLSTASGEVTSEKPMTTKATSPKLSTISYKSITESEQEETTSPGWISSQTTKMSTESGEVTSSYKSSPGKPITTTVTSSKITTISPKSTTESEHEEITSHVAGFMKTTKMSTGSREVTSEHIAVSSKPVTTKATSLKVSTIPHKSTTESEHEEFTSQGPISIKTTKLTTESGEVTSVKPMTSKATSPKLSTIPQKSTTESEQEKTTSTGRISSKTTKMSTESGEVTSSYKSSPGKPITTTVSSSKISTISPKSTTKSEHEEITSQVAGSMKTTKMSTGSGEVTSEHIAVSSKPVTTKATSLKVSTIPHKSTTESEHEEFTSQGPISIKTTKLSTASGEMTSEKPMTTKATSPKLSTISHKSTTESEQEETTSTGWISSKTTKMSTTISPKSTIESEHEEITSQVAGSMKTTKMSTGSGEVTSEHIAVSSKPVTTKATSLKVSTIPHKSTTESQHEEFTSQGPISTKTTKLFTASGKVKSVKPMTSKATSPKLSTIPQKSTTESEQEETTSTGWISSKTTKMSTESGEVTSSFKSSPGKPITTKATSSKITTISPKSTTESEHEEITSQVAGSVKTTKMSTGSGEVTSEHISVSSKPVTTKATSLKVSTIPHKFTTESEHEKYTSQGLISIKTTKLSTASGEVTSEKPITTKATSPKSSTIPHKSTTESEQEETTSTGWISSKTTKMSTTISPKSTTESEHEEITSQVAGYMKTTKMSTGSREVTSEHVAVSSKPVTIKATSLKVSTIPHKSTTESEQEETTSSGWIASKTTKLSTESGEVTSSYKSSPGKPITAKSTSSKITTISPKSTTESEHEEITSQVAGSMKTTKMSTASGEVTSEHISVFSKPVTTKATSLKVSTIPHKSTTESEHEEFTSNGPISIKTTKLSTESGEGTSAQKFTSEKPMTTKATSPKLSTISHKSTTESEQEETTSPGWIFSKTTKMSTASGEMTSERPTAKATSPKLSTISHKSTTESQQEETTSPHRISLKTTKMSTESGEVTFSYKSSPGKPITTKATSSKKTTISLKSTTESEHEEITSQVAGSMKTTKMSTQGEVTSPYKSSPTGSIAASTRISTVRTASRGTASYSASTVTAGAEYSSQQPKSTKQATFSTLGKVSTENTITKSSQLTTAAAESFSTARCMCNVNRVLVSPGNLLYNTTDNAGWCFYARCNETCQVESYSEQCQVSTVPTIPSSTKTAKTVTTSTGTGSTTKTVSTRTSQTAQTKTSATSIISVSTPPPGCSAVMPPRKVNESWMIDQCTKATCTGQNNIAIKKTQCAPVSEVVCANRLQPKNTYDESGCCYQKECECVCGGWGTSHYITFDGVYYSFNGQCTYVLVQQITPVFDHFRVYIDNFSCVPADPSCIKTLRIMYKTDTIVLTSHSLNNQVINEVYINNERAYPAVLTNGITITSSGIFVVVQIPEIGAYISFGVLSFSIKVPISKFSGNTEGHCGKCTNNQLDDCILPDGQLAPSCPLMASQWGVPSEGSSSCSSMSTSVPTTSTPATLQYSSLPSTYVSTLWSSLPDSLPTTVPATEISLLPSTFSSTTQTTQEPCNTPEICKIILSRYNEAFFNKSRNDFMEGCYCPEGTTKFNTITHKCVTTCGCAGPDGMPREVATSVSVPISRRPVSLAMKLCHRWMLEAAVLSTNVPGGLVPSSNPCEKCMCDSTMNETSGQHHVSCTPVLCSIKCAKGFMHQEVPGQCCGTCVQAQCIMDLPDNSTYLLNPGETWSPPGDNCTEYKCVQKKDKLLTVSTKMSCPNVDLDNCVPGTIQKDDKGCCPTCIQKTKCQKVKAKEIILQNGCKSLNAVEMSYCKGNCESQSKYSTNSQSMEQTCGCCKETTTEMVTIDLSCPNGTVTKYTFITVKSCSCSDSPCNKHNEDDADKSHLTKPASQNTTNALKPTGKTEDSNEKQSENESSELESVENKQHEKNVTGEKESKQLSENQVTKPVTKITEGVIKITNSSNGSKSNETVKDESGSEQTHESKITMVTEKAMNTRGQSMVNTAIKQSNKTVTTNVEDGDVSNSKNGKPQDNLPEAKPVTKLIPQSTQKTPQTAKLSSATGKEGHTSGTGK
ncbi:mucin-5AC-like [Hyperolius riggenbachi]|uniref:mucin-5AC-like n=1 Tax=Hyperolius riggenbachi TaxID=752182 RepID=UPI0035A2FB8B